MGRTYRSDCVRMHFFDETVRYDEGRTDITCSDLSLEDHYFGYIVLRPTIVSTLGRSLLSPDMRLGARGRAIQSIHYVNVLGHRLSVWGFPSMAQHVDIAVCAHVCCWAILRYYSETHSQHREYLLHDITKLAAPFDPGGLVPSLGVTVLEAERVFQAAGCFPLVVLRPSSSSDGFFSQFLSYLESGFPLFVEIPAKVHASVIVGYNWRKSVASQQSSGPHVWAQVETLLTVDDNLLPYAPISLHSDSVEASQPPYAADQFNSFIVALPEKIYYPADAVDDTCRAVKSALERSRGPQQEPLELQRYFITTVSKLREHARQHQTTMGDSLVGLLMRLETAQFVWVVEYCSVKQWQGGHVAARAVVDATASSTDKMPFWLLHDEEVAHVFDRSSAVTAPMSICLKRTGRGPLPRMELNLRPIVESSASNRASKEAAAPGGNG